MLADTHVHFGEFAPDEIGALLERAKAAGVERFVAVGGNAQSNRRCQSLAGQHPGIMVAAVGYDRDQSPQAASREALEEILSSPGIAAVGEIGLDYYYGAERKASQRKLFDAMLEIAQDHRLPVVVHSREAEADTLAALRDFAAQCRRTARLPGVLHCFTGSTRFMEKLLEMGFFISFSGIVTFPSATSLRQVVPLVPDDYLLIETDAPLLAPQPVRGRRNEPAYLTHIADCVAELRQVSREAIAEITSCNAQRLFFAGSERPPRPRSLPAQPNRREEETDESEPNSSTEKNAEV